jgi:DNA-binding NarL/FixJ family response regulator
VAHQSLLSAARPASAGFDCEPYLLQPTLLERDSEPLGASRQGLEGPSEARRSKVIALATLWTQLTSRRLVILDESYSEDQESCITLSRGAPRVATSTEARDFVVLRRALTGEPRKCIAFDLGIAQSTVAMACANALKVLGVGPSAARAPLVLLLAAHAASNAALSLSGASALLIDAGSFWIARAACPDERFGRRLTSSEHSVMRLLLRGKTRAQIALDRRTSERTVANQLNAVFRKLRISGRAELVGRLISANRELGD